MAVTLPDAEWRKGSALKAILKAMPEARFVGGCVRDTLAGQVAKDIDLATPLLPDVVIHRLEAAGIKAIPTGFSHGTITAVAKGQTIEITTLRRDVSTDGRRATIAFTRDWREDAARRDFTINALYADPQTGEVFDWFGGTEDLANGIVRFIGAPLERIAEDHLRALRFFRFHARFGKGAPDSASLSACVGRANDLMALSRERIAQELLALLALTDPAPTIALMIKSGIFAPVLPEISDPNALPRLDQRERDQAIAPDAIRRLAALLPPDPKAVEDIAYRLKLSNAQRKRLVAAASRGEQDADAPFALAYRLGVEAATDRLLIGDGDASQIACWTPPSFPLSGGAIVTRGIKAGPEVARILKEAEAQWVAEGFPGADRLDAITQRVLSQSLERAKGIEPSS
jgi:poly(A) polymerase